MWNQLSNEIKDNLDSPLSDNLEILKISKIITEELEVDKQVFLINFIQKKWWRKTKNRNMIKILEDLKINIKSFIQPRLSWEVALLKIAIKDL